LTRHTLIKTIRGRAMEEEEEERNIFGTEQKSKEQSKHS
jgi:hypothetical protein